MSNNKTVFIIGPGFIGWNVVELLLKENYKVTGLVRREEHAKAIQGSGASTVLGDLNDSNLITTQTVEHDIIIHTATADHKPSVEAVLTGISARCEANKPTIFIHTSGTSNLDDNARGAFKTDTIYHDTRRAEIDSVPDTAPHRQIDLAIVNAADQLSPKGAKLAIMVPPLIYGVNAAHDRLSIQIPTLTRFALKHGFAGHLGAGLAVESQVHVLDLARAYVVLLRHLERSPAAEVALNPYYFCENGAEVSWREVAENIGREVHAKGFLADATPREIPEDMWDDLFGREFTPAVVGLNSRSRAVRLRELGWRAKEKGIWESYREDELPRILREWEEKGGKEGFRGYVGTAVS